MLLVLIHQSRLRFNVKKLVTSVTNKMIILERIYKIPNQSQIQRINLNVPRHHFLQYCSTFISCATSARLLIRHSSLNRRESRLTNRNSTASSETPKLTLSKMESVMWSKNSSSDKYSIHFMRRLSFLRMSSLRSNNLLKVASQSRPFSISL